ncbi:hypothetical protein [Sphingosinicella sp. BN140058]|uniref:hypothetical protein n=1 Tax=Sphingosinicella sp. BN140058 TaxID=1892855 RepID=UPI0013ECAE74|nr:hypothetical protein [Sphingosinicella sp. BN140058]
MHLRVTLSRWLAADVSFQIDDISVYERDKLIAGCKRLAEHDLGPAFAEHGEAANSADPAIDAFFAQLTSTQIDEDLRKSFPENDDPLFEGYRVVIEVTSKATRRRQSEFLRGRLHRVGQNNPIQKVALYISKEGEVQRSEWIHGGAQRSSTDVVFSEERP